MKTAVSPLADPCHEPPVTPSGALRYSPALNSIRSFYRLCDGLQTLALVDENGFLAEIVDVEQWAQPYSDTELPVPSPARYQTHSRATLCGGYVCMILTPNGEMKIFANGVQVFLFRDGRWRLTDAERKYGLDRGDWKFRTCGAVVWCGPQFSRGPPRRPVSCSRRSEHRPKAGVEE